MAAVFLTFSLAQFFLVVQACSAVKDHLVLNVVMEGRPIDLCTELTSGSGRSWYVSNIGWYYSHESISMYNNEHNATLVPLRDPIPHIILTKEESTKFDKSQAESWMAFC